MAKRTAIALLSGGLDSATAAALAQEAGHRVIGLSFDYGQRHRRELKAAAKVAAHLNLAEHHQVDVNLGAWGGSALTDPNQTVPTSGVEEGVIPVTYVLDATRSSLRLGSALPKPEGPNGWFLA